MQKTLTILRHAKTETASAGQEDFDRRLTGRGVADAQLMGKYLVTANIQPDKVLCSTAVRTRETWDGLGFSSRELIEFTQKLYHASANEIIAVVGMVPEVINSLMVIGHNPGLHELCLKLAKKGDPALLGILSAQLPTCALVTIVFDGPWRGIAQAQTMLGGFVTPRML